MMTAQSFAGRRTFSRLLPRLTGWSTAVDYQPWWVEVEIRANGPIRNGDWFCFKNADQWNNVGKIARLLDGDIDAVF